MNHILISIVVAVLCALFKWISERFQHDFQRFGIAPLVGGALYLEFCHPLVASTPLLSIAVFVLGYSFYGKSDFWDRFLWLMDCEVFLWLGCFLLGYLDCKVFGIAILVSGLWGALTRKGNNNWVAPISGAILGVVYFLIHNPIH